MNCANCCNELPKGKRKYCSDKCSSQGWHKQNLLNRPTAKCIECSKGFKQTKNGGANGDQLTMCCSSRCGYQRKHRIDREINLIKSMGITIDAVRDRRAKQIDRADSKAKADYVNALYLDAKRNHCRVCGGDITQDTNQNCKRYCDQCQSTKKSAYLSLARRTGIIPTGGDRSRAKHYGVEYEPIKRKVVFDLHDWHCAQCNDETPKELKGTINTKAPELDHVIPISKGGPHTYANVQLLCRECNAIKSDT